MISAAQIVAIEAEQDMLGHALESLAARAGQGMQMVDVDVVLPGYSVPGAIEGETSRSYAGARFAATVAIEQAQGAIAQRQAVLLALLGETPPA